MFRNTIVALSLALSTLALPVIAHAEARPVAAKEGKEAKKFPMPAAEFKKHVDARIAKVKARVERHIEKKQVPAEKAKEIREKMAAGIAKVNKVVEKVTADGTVSKEEAKEVHDAMRALHGGHKKEKKSALAKRLPAMGPQASGELFGDPREVWLDVEELSVAAIHQVHVDAAGVGSPPAVGCVRGVGLDAWA